MIKLLLISFIICSIFSLLLFIQVIRKKISFLRFCVFVSLQLLFGFIFFYNTIHGIASKFRNIKHHVVGRAKDCDCKKNDLIKNDYKTVHRPMAIAVTNNGLILDHKVLKKRLKLNKLVNVVEGDGFYMIDAKNSEQCLTPLAEKRLKELGKLFRSVIESEENKKDYFVISSMTRTEAQQEIIRKQYPRAATKGFSTHSYGVSFDISEIISFGKCSSAQKALKVALSKMQREKKILLCPETKCIHVTVIK
jgi:hypothetical protein